MFYHGSFTYDQDNTLAYHVVPWIHTEWPDGSGFRNPDSWERGWSGTTWEKFNDPDGIPYWSFYYSKPLRRLYAGRKNEPKVDIYDRVGSDHRRTGTLPALGCHFNGNDGIWDLVVDSEETIYAIIGNEVHKGSPTKNGGFEEEVYYSTPKASRLALARTSSKTYVIASSVYAGEAALYRISPVLKEGRADIINVPKSWNVTTPPVIVETRRKTFWVSTGGTYAIWGDVDRPDDQAQWNYFDEKHHAGTDAQYSAPGVKDGKVYWLSTWGGKPWVYCLDPLNPPHGNIPSSQTAMRPEQFDWNVYNRSVNMAWVDC
ncbi:hypothetical protein B1H18_21520 [Streptomyces tsukubensis]|uniref:Uncharacterized protein n=1 Tax=Streptomyces tsukubensis TaxID=83656 RepID=A0A1V4A5G2_9ACTN|nr:hypothetical protein B1H18_21520 [Streptomyces tsukubensis]